MTTTRIYDYIITVANAALFQNGNVVIGANSLTTGTIVNVDISTNNIKIKVSNSIQEFDIGEYLYSNTVNFTSVNVSVSYSNTSTTSYGGNTYIINGTTNTFAIPDSEDFIPNTSSIVVKHGANTIPSTAYEFPSPILGNQGITFKPFIFNKTFYTPTYQEIEDKFKTQFGNYSGATLFRELIPTNEYLNWRADNLRSQTAVYTTTIEYDQISDYLTPGIITLINPHEVTTVSYRDEYSNVNVTIPLPVANVDNLTISIINGEINVSPYIPPIVSAASQTAFSIINSVYNNPFTKHKNQNLQNPIVNLYTIYYPGEWYPANANGNPTGEGTGYSWPVGFPYRFAEIRGDYISDINYSVVFDGLEYTPYPMDSSGIGIDSSGKINDVTLTLLNYDNLITQLVENPYLVGNVTSNSTQAIVNGELLTGIDPITATNNAHFNEELAISIYGKVNSAWTYDQAINRGETWRQLKIDTRDLLGGVVEIKSTFAHFLDVWPEYSTVSGKFSNVVEVKSSLPYRIGDIIKSNTHTRTANIINIIGNALHLDCPDDFPEATIGKRIYIVNSEADPDSYVQEKFKIANLNGLDEHSAKFSLTSWLQYFKLQLPKRKYYKNSCPWVYRGEECQYPSNGSDTIPGSYKAANGYFSINNIEVFTTVEDVCAKNYEACKLRNNEIHYGAFISSGRAIPR